MRFREGRPFWAEMRFWVGPGSEKGSILEAFGDCWCTFGSQNGVLGGSPNLGSFFGEKVEYGGLEWGEGGLPLD